MKVKIKDYEKFIDTCNQIIVFIEKERKERNLKYEIDWRKRGWPFKNRLDTEFPEKNDHWNFKYPCKKYGYQLDNAKKIKRALESKHLEAVYLDENELDLLTFFKE